MSTTPVRYAVQGRKYLERRKVKKPDRYQEAGGPAEYYSFLVQYSAPVPEEGEQT